MVRLKSVIPELNLWLSNILYNNDLNIVHTDIPSKINDKWRCKDSVIDLLFNECSDPSGTLYDGHHFITRYKSLNLDRVYTYDSSFYSRIQIVRNRCYLFAADDPNNQELQDVFNLVIPSFVIDTNNVDTIAQSAGVSPTKYVTKYQSEIITTGTDELHRMLPDREPDPEEPEPGIYTPGEDIFKFTEEELEMLEYLYYYRTGQYELIHCFPCDFYYTLVSPLSKWIYLYLQCYVFKTINWKFLATICKPEIHGLLRTAFEKHAQDRIYQFVQKQFYVIWNEIQDLGGNELRRIFKDYTMPCNTFVCRSRIKNDNLKEGKIVLNFEQEQQPYTSRSFEFIYNGVILKPGKNYEVVNEGNLKNSHVTIHLKDISKFTTRTKYQLMWSIVSLSSPYSRKKGFETK